MALCSDHDDVADECPGCRIVALEERLAHMEVARDNVSAQLDQSRERVRRLKSSAGSRISQLVDLVERLCQETPESTRDWARGRMAEILDRADGAEKRVAQ